MLKGQLVYQKTGAVLIMLDHPQSLDTRPVPLSVTTLTQRCILLMSISGFEVAIHWYKLLMWSMNSHQQLVIMLIVVASTEEVVGTSIAVSGCSDLEEGPSVANSTPDCLS